MFLMMFMLKLVQRKSTKSDLNIGVDQNIHETSDKHAKKICKTKSITESSDALLDNSKTMKFEFKINDFNSLNNETSTSHLMHESYSSCTSKTIHFADHKKKSRCSLRSSIKMLKATKVLNTNDIETDDTMEKNCKTKDISLNPITEDILHPSTPIPSLHIKNVSKETHKLNNKNNNSLSGRKEILTDSLSSLETKFNEQELDAKKIAQMKLLQSEIDTLDYIHKLRSALSIKRFDYEMALQSLEQIRNLKINALMLIKHQIVVDTIIKVTKYVGNASEWRLSEQEAIRHSEQAAKVRYIAQTIYHKFVSLFTNGNIEQFKEIYDKRVNEFKTKTRHLDRDQIYGCTLVKP
uniref:Lens epithelium-derived growth factor integrase-binding domain-containing protein n=1 Tax=Sipha flava TaxID=143950 RepID=A0A2S2QJM3_9HEMI